MGLRLQRHLGSVTTMNAAQYTTRTVSGGVAICCPACGGISDLEDTHHVSVGGIITPQWHCPFVSCSAAQWLSLDSWQE